MLTSMKYYEVMTMKECSGKFINVNQKYKLALQRQYYKTGGENKSAGCGLVYLESELSGYKDSGRDGSWDKDLWIMFSTGRDIVPLSSKNTCVDML